ncbi:hypothetical protein FQZ97_941740 [compost metagenome]
MLFDMTCNGCDKAGNTTFHVDGAATIHNAVFNGCREGRMLPVGFIAWRHNISVASKHQMSAIARLARIEVFNVWRAFIGEDRALDGKAHRCKHAFKCRQRAAFSGRNRRAANESGKVFGRIGRQAHDDTALF